MRQVWCWLIVALCTAPIAQPHGATAQPTCPAHAHFVGSEISGNVRTTHCACDEGYENAGGGCVRATTMRAQTRAECIRFAGEQLRDDLAKCKSPVVECLTNAGVRPNEAFCAASALVVALDQSKVTVLGALLACGDKIHAATDVCGPTWGACQASPLQAHKKAVDTCPKG